MGEAPIDPNVQAVIRRFKARARKGLETYGVDTTRTDLGLMEWLQHLQDELLDAAIYVERLKQETDSNSNQGS